MDFDGIFRIEFGDVLTERQKQKICKVLIEETVESLKAGGI